MPKSRTHCLLVCTVGLLTLPGAQAFEVDTGHEDWSVRLDNTIKYNYGVRTQSADKRMLATPNNNDGDYNFRKAGTTITNRVDLLTELDVIYQQRMGFRVSAASWYDKAYDNTGSNANPFVNGNGEQSGINPSLNGLPGTGVPLGSPHLSNYAQRYYSGPSGEVLDAFVFMRTEVGETSELSGKLGQHNLFWGETLLNPVHSLSYGQSGLDLAKLAASPGTEAKELFVPRNQLSASFLVNPELTLGAQYFLDWDAARLPEAGTYYGGSDLVGEGAQSFLLGHTGTPGLIPVQGALTNIRRGHDLTPRKRGDWGVMAKWSPEWLDGTLGFYYRKSSEILPQAWLDARGLTVARGPFGNPPAGLPGAVGNLYNSLQSATYQFAYADDIDIYGLSLSKDVGGISVGSDLNIRHNMPLSSIPAIVSAPGQGGLGNGFGLLPPRLPSSGVIYETPHDGDSMSATGDTLHWTLNGLMSIGDTPLFDSATLLGELFYSNLLKLDSHNEALYKGKGSYRGIDKPTRDNLGIAVNFTPTWYQVFPGVDMSLPLSINVGLDGVSPVQGGGAEDTGNYAVGVSAALYNQYFVDLKYVDSFGKAESCKDGQTDGSTPNALDGEQDYTCYGGGYASFSGGGATTEDRGALYLTLKTTF
ncbi:DUF1302 domain-containing protein [Pseudomonas guariconensis]|uniref:DUF1302 domain-containing protein n=1 Tax=Pseudomonas guariconensis TaxID=1288410 RepID=UPI0025AA2BC0|nr:DUF1302 domain-containing protein [Pseudomonas guariconensis]MDM9593510.1 DUF1302 domain-containing protein [Pseudomonas guariconensis]MDM9606337.1 DUF1302 domain-containing protein [Pseudomonas guariconensis]MDM9611294.1 DUF1302 domain-containing protein [Pseudomonas guariconensis]